VSPGAARALAKRLQPAYALATRRASVKIAYSLA
jgi:hypothetical protein